MLFAVAKPSFGFHLLVTLHLLCVIGGFGYLAYSGVFFSAARRRGDAAGAGALEANRTLAQLAELLVIAAFVFGVAAVGASPSGKFGQGWIGGGMACWIVALGILHGFIRPQQRHYAAAVADLPPTAPGDPAPAQVAQLDRMERNIAAGWGVFNVVVVVAVVLMVFQPGR